MIDINYQSKVERDAPEEKIPIYNILNMKYVLGGAANVALNLKNLGANVEILGVVGDDMYGKKIQNLLDEYNINNKLFIDNTRNTTQKNRIFFNNKLKVRYDIENTHDISKIIEENILEYVVNKPNIHAIVISDYDKGFITEHMCQTIINYANTNNIPTFIDPKIKNYLKYKNCFLFKPNIKEAQEISNKKELNDVINTINKKIGCKNLLITRGSEGMILNSISIEHENTIEVIDVTGAGDIVLAVLVYIFLKYDDMFKACRIANYVAGKSVGVIGNYHISENDIDDYKNSKIIYDYEVNKILKISNNKNKNIVFTNGCFDILHSAHIKCLQFAKSKGDILVVGLNSDDSVKRLKGSDRPINTIQERSTMLSLFDFVDFIIIFSDNTPYTILKILKPNTLVKGSDYKIENIIGNEIVENIYLFNYIEGKSSTNVIKKIKQI